MANLTTLQPNRSAWPNSVIDRLFTRLHAMYGKAWLDLWADANIPNVKAVWAESLRNVSVEEMRLAIEAMEKKGSAFPPSLPEFKFLCGQFKADTKLNLYLTAPRTDAPADVFKNLRAAILKGRGDAA